MWPLSSCFIGKYPKIALLFAGNPNLTIFIGYCLISMFAVVYIRWLFHRFNLYDPNRIARSRNQAAQSIGAFRNR